MLHIIIYTQGTGPLAGCTLNVMNIQMNACLPLLYDARILTLTAALVEELSSNVVWLSPQSMYIFTRTNHAPGVAILAFRNQDGQNQRWRWSKW